MACRVAWVEYAFTIATLLNVSPTPTSITQRRTHCSLESIDLSAEQLHHILLYSAMQFRALICEQYNEGQQHRVLECISNSDLSSLRHCGIADPCRTLLYLQLSQVGTVWYCVPGTRIMLCWRPRASTSMHTLAILPFDICSERIR